MAQQYLILLIDRFFNDFEGIWVVSRKSFAVRRETGNE